MSDGPLLYSSGGGGQRYLALGVYGGQLLMEFDTGSGIQEVREGAELDHW